ncbi:uncharacterized protein [Primulina eburnea]|uniref:uncharacterized protein n=1 Tax=Primulina eburnea TaxID=1245227 RepID=UPI003C6CAB18
MGLPPSQQYTRTKKKRFCTLHKVCYHNTEDCKTVKRDYVTSSVQGHNQPSKSPRLPPWAARYPGPSASEDSRNAPRGRRDAEPERKKSSSPVLGVIKMISRGCADGDSNRAHKSRSRRDFMEVEGVRKDEAVISFGPEDLEGVNLPHNDALIIQAKTANYDIMRVFVDSGRSVNVIFKETIIQMNLQGYHLEAVNISLLGFSGHAIYPEGEIVLPLSLGTVELKETVMTTFTVVDAPSSYNIILGRPAMNELRVVASTHHQKIKFPIGSRVGEVRGDQPSSWKCYVEAVVVDQKRARKEGRKFRVVERWRGFAESRPHSGSTISYMVLNVVLMPKSTGKWRMCMDFRDLNKACPKDHPLPRIDQLVDSTSGCELLSFMDAYKGYHQIPLAKEDQDNASFITSGGTFCYRLMNKVFEKKLGSNVELYVDDILGKSREFSDIIFDLKEIFATLMQYGIKLNPAKCIFGVKSGEFLGFMVTDGGIEVNQEKVKSVLDMPSPRSVREVQKLTGRIASHSRFISRSAHRSYPFFQVLRKAQ